MLKKKKKENIEKKIPKQTNKTKKKKNGLEVWWIGTIPPNIVLIYLLVFEKTGFTDRRTDGRTTDRCPHDDSSSAVQWHKTELENCL